jgi:hypothetical protein
MNDWLCGILSNTFLLRDLQRMRFFLKIYFISFWQLTWDWTCRLQCLKLCSLFTSRLNTFLKYHESKHKSGGFLLSAQNDYTCQLKKNLVHILYMHYLFLTLSLLSCKKVKLAIDLWVYFHISLITYSVTMGISNRLFEKKLVILLVNLGKLV